MVAGHCGSPRNGASGPATHVTLVDGPSVVAVVGPAALTFWSLPTPSSLYRVSLRRLRVVDPNGVLGDVSRVSWST
jgi:hypothetical protein